MKTIFLTIILLAILSTSLHGKEPVTFNIDDIDYFIYKGQRVTFEGLMEMIVQEKRTKFTAELRKLFRIKDKDELL